MMPFRAALLHGAAAVGGGGPTTDVVMAVQDFDTGSSTSAQNFTSATITGITPKAALILAPFHDPTNDPGETAGLSLGIGMMQSTTNYNFRIWGRDNNATTNNGKVSHAGRAYEVFNNSGSTFKAATSGSLISGGISLTIATNTAPSLRAAYVAFCGADTSAHVGTAALGTGTSAIDITAPAFQPDAVIFVGVQGDHAHTLTLDMAWTFGIGVYEGGNYTQRCVLWAENNAEADSKPFQTLRDDCIGGSTSNADGSLTYKVTFSDVDANGFSVTPSANTGSNELGYMALKFAGRKVKLVDFVTPTATGSHTITGAGFTPRFAIVVLTNLEAVNSHPGTTSDNQSGFAIGFIGSDEQWAASWRINAAEATTDTASQLSAAGLMGASATDCDAIKATFTAWTGDGVTLNFSAVQGTGKKGFILFVE